MIDDTEKGTHYNELAEGLVDNSITENKEPEKPVTNNEESHSDYEISNHVEVKMNKIPESKKKKFVVDDLLDDLNNNGNSGIDINGSELPCDTGTDRAAST